MTTTNKEIIEYYNSKVNDTMKVESVNTYPSGDVEPTISGYEESYLADIMNETGLTKKELIRDYSSILYSEEEYLEMAYSAFFSGELKFMTYDKTIEDYVECYYGG